MNRRHGWLLLLACFAGCSTHPITDIYDSVRPGKLGPITVALPYGGVGIPQGPIVPVAPSMPAPGAAPAPGGGVIPGPAPLPGNIAPGVQIQNPVPTTDIPPLPPTPPGNFGR